MFLEGLGVRRITRVPPGGALFIELLKKEGIVFVRMYLYKDVDHQDTGDLMTIIKFPLEDKYQGDLIEASLVLEFLRTRLSSEGPNFLDTECDNLSVAETSELLDADYTIKKLIKFYDLTDSHLSN